MRSGKSMGTYNVNEISTSDMSKLMVGREVVLEFDKQPAKVKDVMLSVSHLDAYNAQGVQKVRDLSFELHGGEILGIAGVEGNGQSELIDAITGMSKKYTGTITIKGEDIKNDSIRDIRQKKLAHIPEDRMTAGCAAHLNIQENMFANQYTDPKYSGKVMLKSKVIQMRSDELIKEYLVKCKSQKQEVGMLSGGNIQKVIVAREFSTGPDIIILKPTRGIDVGRQFIRRKLLSSVMRAAQFFVSADLNEIFSLSDRLAVMYKGNFSGVFTDVAGVTKKNLVSICLA
ncbi:MAG: ATP-binding cassette domain-containing protein [Lachnospiraceae bacterium]